MIEISRCNFKYHFICYHHLINIQAMIDDNNMPYATSISYGHVNDLTFKAESIVAQKANKIILNQMLKLIIAKILILLLYVST